MHALASYSELKTVFVSTAPADLSAGPSEGTSAPVHLAPSCGHAGRQRARGSSTSVAGGADRGQDPLGVLTVADLHGDLHAGLAHVEVDALADVLDLDEVGPPFADHATAAGPARPDGR